MIELRPVPVILVSFYCFLVGLFFFSVAVNAIFGSSGTSDSVLWLLVAAAIVLAAALVTVGIGILYYNQLCWKILFFFLMVFISNVAALILVVLILLCLDAGLFYKYYQSTHITPVTWASFLAIFLSGIIVFYYHTRKEIVSYFGGMGDLLEPF